MFTEEQIDQKINKYIKNNKYIELEKLLSQEEIRLTSHQLFNYIHSEELQPSLIEVLEKNNSLPMHNENLDPSLLDLLQKYKALPEATTASTLKCILFLGGNKNIKEEDFWGREDFNPKGCSGFHSPMFTATRAKNVYFVDKLIKINIEERPIDFVFNSVHWSFIKRVELRMIEKCKENSKEIIVDAESEICALFLLNSSEELKIELEESKNYYKECKKFSGFFSWLGRKNRSDLLTNIYVQNLFKDYPEDAQLAPHYAAIYHNKEFIITLFEQKLFSEEHLDYCLSIAVVQDDIDMIQTIYKSMQNSNFSFDNLKNKFMSHPLFWAIRNTKNEALELLLDFGMKPDSFSDSRRGIHVAARLGNREAITLLLKHNAQINSKDDFLGDTALHLACEKGYYDIAEYLLSQGADATIKNNKGRTAFELVVDPIKKIILEKIAKDCNKSFVGKIESSSERTI